MPCSEKPKLSSPYIQGIEVETMKTFKSLGSLFDTNGGVEKDVNNRLKIAWSKWRETTVMTCDRSIGLLTTLKEKVDRTAINPRCRPYGAECWEVRKREAGEFHITGMRMLRWVRGKKGPDHVGNVDIWKEAYTWTPMSEFLGEKRLRWFGHVQRRDKDEATRNILQMTVKGKRKRSRPKLK